MQRIAFHKELQTYHSYLFSVAYNILGQIHEAEDIVQDAFEYMLTLPAGHVKNMKTYLTRVVANKSIDRLKMLKRARTHYPGTWLPEPYVEVDEAVANTDQPVDMLSYSLMWAMETLNPVERAVFILREAFDYAYHDLAEICGISEANCRQILSRAKKKVKQASGKDQSETDQEEYQRLIAAFLRARQEEDPGALARLLKEDIIVYSDGGGKAPAAMVPLEGVDVVLRFLTGIARKQQARELSYRLVYVNHQPAILLSSGAQPDTLISFDVTNSSINRIFIIRNPDKILLR